MDTKLSEPLYLKKPEPRKQFNWYDTKSPASELTDKVTRYVGELSQKVHEKASEQAAKEVLRKESERTYAQRQAEKRKWEKEQRKKIEKEIEEKRKKEREEEERKLKEKKELQKKDYWKDVWDFYDKSNTNPENFLIMKDLFALKNAIGSIFDNQSKGHMTELEGKISDKDVSKAMSDAYLKKLDYQKQINQLEEQRDLFSEAFLPDIESLTKGPVDDYTKKQIDIYDQYNKEIEKLQQKINDPDLKQLSDAYQSEYVKRYEPENPFSWVKNHILNPVFDSFASISVLPSKQKSLEQHILDNRLKLRLNKYNSVLQNKINKNGGNELSEIERFNKDIEAEQDAYRKEYADEAKFNLKANEHFDIAESYKRGIELYQNESLWSPYYLFYELPLMQGSSLSSKNQQKQMALLYGGLGAAALAAPFTAGGSAVIGILSQLGSTGYMLPSAEDENYTEMGAKRASNLKEILLESYDYDTILEDLYKKGVDYWKKQGMSDKWIKDRYSDSEGETNVFLDLASGVIDSGHPDVNKALIYSTAGLRALFDANMMRTAGELPGEVVFNVLQPVKAFTPAKWKNAIGSAWKNTGEYFGFRSGEKEVVKRAARNSVGKSVKGTPKTAPSSGYNNNFSSVFNNTSTNSKKPYVSPTTSIETPGTTWDSFKKGFSRGYVAGDVAGLGYSGSMASGVASGIASATMHMAREKLGPNTRAFLSGFENSIKHKYQAIYDATIGKREWTKLAAKYGYYGGRSALIRGFAEGGEELGQYQNEIAEYAAKYGYNGMSLGNMIAEDMGTGLRNAQFYMAYLGIGDSPLLDDAEAVSNWKGGFVLGGANSGTIQIATSIPNVLKEYDTSELIGTWGFMDRELGKSIRALNTDMVMHIMNNRENAIISVLEDAKRADSRRKDSEYSTEDYDEKINSVNELAAIAKNKKFRSRMEAHGIQYGTKEYATAVADYYDVQRQNDQNRQSNSENLIRRKAYYSSKDYNDKKEKIVNRALDESVEDNIFVLKLTADYVNLKVNEFIKQAKEAGEDTSTEEFKNRVDEIRKSAETEGNETARQQLIDVVDNKSLVVNRLNALFRLKQRLNSIDDIFDMLHHKFGLTTKRLDASSIIKNINKQIELAKKDFKIFNKDFDADNYEEFLKYIDGDETIILSDEAEDIEFTQAILNADKSIIDGYSRLYNRGYIKNSETGKIEYNPEEDRYQQELSERALMAQYAKTEYKPDEKHTVAKAPEGDSPLKKRITHIIDTNERNKELDWMLTEVYSGDAANKLLELIDEEESKYQEEKIKRLLDYINKQLKQSTEKSKKATPKVKAPEKHAEFGNNKDKWKKRKDLAKKRYENRKKAYKDFNKGAMRSSIPFEHLIVAMLNKAVELVEQGVYTFAEFLEDVSSTFKYDVEGNFGQLKGLYIDAIASFAKLGDKASLNKLESIDEVMGYGVEERPAYIVPEILTIPLYKYVQMLFEEDQRKIRSDLSSYYDTIVDDNGIITIYTNKYGLENQNFSAYDHEILILTDANTSDESFKQALIRIVPNGFPIDEFVKLRQVPGIIPAIIRKKISDTKNRSVTESLMARNAVLAVLTGNEQEIDGYFVEEEKNEFVEKIKKLKEDIDRFGYRIINTGQFIYTTTESGDNISAEADIILMNDDGDIRIIDIFNSYRDPVANFDNPINRYTNKTTRKKETELLHYLETTITEKLNRTVKGLGALPVLISGSGGVHVKAYDVIRINTLYLYNGELLQLKAQAESLIDQLNEAVLEYNTLSLLKKHIYMPISYTDVGVYKDYVAKLLDDLNIIKAEIELLRDSDIDELELSYQEWLGSHIDEFEFPEPTLELLLGILKDKCRELDMQLEFLPIARPYGLDEVNNLRIIEKTLIEAQVALNDFLAHEGSTIVDILNEQELLVTAIERFVKSANYYGEDNKIVQRWWANNFVPKPTDKGNYPEYDFYYATINSWINTLTKDNHILDIDDHEDLLLFYSYVLNNTFTKLLLNAEDFANSGRVTDTRAVFALLKTIKKGKDLIVEFNMSYGVEPDETYDMPAETDIEKINRMPVKWKDFYSISDKHSPAYDAIDEIGSDGKFSTRSKLYWLISLMPDLLNNYYTYNNATDIENMDPTATKFRLYKDPSGEIKLDIIYYDKVLNKEKIVYGLPFIVNVENQLEEYKTRAKDFNRGNKKFLRKVSAMLDYIALHPEENLKITFTVTRNKGSIRYDQDGGFHNVSEFLFADKENSHDLFNIKLGRESGLGVLHKIINKRTGKEIYDVKAADNRTRIGGFDDEYEKMHLNANSGSIIYFYKNGDGTNIGVVMRPKLIGENKAKRLVRLMERYIQNIDNGTTLGYKTIDLIKQCLYVNDGLNKLNENQKTTNMVTIRNDGIIMIGQDAYNIVTLREALIQRISQIEHVMDQDILNESLRSSEDNIFHEVRVKFANDPNLQEELLPNGFKITREDVEKNSTWLGYVLRNGYLGTTAVGKKWRQINIGNLALAPKDQIIEESKLTRIGIIDQNQEEVLKRNLQLKLSGLFMTGDRESAVTRTEDETNEFKKAVKKYFEKVLGENGAVEIENAINGFLPDCPGAFGYCTESLIRLSTEAPYEVMYHEAFHKIMELMLSDKQRESFYEAYRNLHKGEKLTDRDIAEGLADMFVDYMINKNSVKNAKGFSKIKAWWNRLSFLTGMTWKLGLSDAIDTFTLYYKINAGKLAKNTITKERSDRFNNLFGNKLFYTVTNTETNNSFDFKYLKDSSDVSEMVRALGYFFIRYHLINGINKNVEDIKIDAYTLSKIEDEFCKDFKGLNLPEDKVTFVNLVWREIFLKETIVTKDKKGKKHEDVIYPAFDALQKQIVDYVSSITSDYKGKINDDLLDDEDERVQKQNIDKYDKASHEFNPLDTVTERVKLFFATIPYHTFVNITEDMKLGKNAKMTEDKKRVLVLDLSKNKFLSPSLMPIDEVYNIIVNDLHYVNTIEEFDKLLHDKSLKNPMYLHVYNRWRQLYSNVYKYNEDGELIGIDYDKESFCIQIFSAIKKHKSKFVICRSNHDKTGNKSTRIVESSMDRDSRSYSQQWTHFLTSGLVGVFSTVRVNDNLQFRPETDPNIFAKTAAWLMEVRAAIPEGKTGDVIIDGVKYNFDEYKDIERIKSDIIRKLNNIGVLFSKDAFDYMLNTKYSSDRNGIHQFLSESNETSILSFINKLNLFVDERGVINQKVVEEGYTKIGFIKMLGDWLGAYNRNTVLLMALGLNSKKLYSVSLNSSITYMIDALNTRDPNNEFVRRLMGFLYNITEGLDAQGSIILKAISLGLDQYIQAHTYIGFRSDNYGDTGTEYTETLFVEDYIAKMTMLQQGWFVLPTLADKSTWMCLSGITIPGLKFLLRKSDKEEEKDLLNVEDAPTIGWTKTGAYLIPNNKVLDQMIAYANGERLGIQLCMEDLGYDDIPGYIKQGRKKLTEKEKIANYHTPNKDKKTKKVVEPNGTRFLSLTQIAVEENGTIKVYNLNNPNKSSKDMLKLANDKFFSKPLEEQRKIMALTLYIQNNEAIKCLEDHGLVERTDIKWMNDAPIISSTKKNGILNINTSHFNENQIKALQDHFMQQMLDKLTDLPPVLRKNLLEQQARSLAIAAIIGDVTNRSIICSQESHRCFSGHPAMFKVDYDFENGRIKDSTYDMQKRLGGLISTGEDNVTDIPQMRKTYTCAECIDYEVSSTSDVAPLLEEMFIEGEVRETYAETTAELHPENVEKIWDEAYTSDLSKLFASAENDDIKKKLENAKIRAKQYAKSYSSGNINVADGAAYITDKMCEDMLRIRGAYNEDVKKAFEVLRDEKQKYSWKNKKEAWNLIYEKVNIVTTKYTAYGFREHSLNGENVSDIAVPYYNKFALFPLFPCNATGHMKGIYEKMLNERVDMMLMTSAVKLGSQGAVEYKDGEIKDPFNKYEQDFGFLRRLLNTDPEEGHTIAIGTLLVKIILQNLRLYRLDYVVNPETGETLSGQELLDKYMNAIRELSVIGYNTLREKFFNEDGSISPRKLSNYLKEELTARNASKAIIESIQVVTIDGVETLRPLSTTTDAYWIESILISAINKAVIDINTPGSSFVQRSIFAAEGKAKAGEGGILSDEDIQNTTINGGNKLQMINEDGSMDAVVSIDFFKDILPKGLSFNEARLWLIDNEIIGPKAKATAVGYRIPTQAQSSIHALRFVDVISAEKSSIMLPEEFTKITGSDFDIDHLYLFRYNYTDVTVTHPLYNKEIKREKGKITHDFSKYKDSKDNKMRSKYLLNELLDIMMILLKDKKSANCLYKSIDNDTDLIKNIANNIKDDSSTKHLAYNFGTLHEQVMRRNDYITGKKGIGPFALNVTNLILTYLCKVKFKDTEFAKETGIWKLYHLQDVDGNYISSWLSAFINAHVDIVKDPFISKLDVNPFTYNMLNLLVRCGFGDCSVWFLCQPIIKQLAEADINARSQFGRDTQKKKSIYLMRQDAKKKVLLRFMKEQDFSDSVISKYTDGGEKNVRVRINVINNVVKNKELMKAIALNPDAETVTVNNTVYNVKDILKQVYYAWKTLEKYSIALSNLVQHTKIDTRKHGNSFIEILNYLKGYNSIFFPAVDNSLFDLKSLLNLATGSWIDIKTKLAIKLPFEILGGYTFNANERFTDCLISMVRMLETDEHKINTDTVNFLSKSLLTLIKSIYFVKWAKDCLLNEKGEPMTDADFTRLFVGNYSIHARLNMLKYHIANNPKYQHLKDNMLILQIRILDPNSDEKKPCFITIADNVDDSKINSDKVIDGWEDLLNDPDPTVRKFANDLILYSFLTSGEFNGWNKLLKYVPPSWLFGQYSDGYESFSSFVSRALMTMRYDPEFMLLQIISNNFLDYRICQRVSLTNEEDRSANYVFIGTPVEKEHKYVCIGKSVTNKQLKNIPKFIAMKAGRGYDARFYNVYKLVGTVLDKNKLNVPVYVMIKKKGYHEGNNDIYEYMWNFDYEYNSINDVRKDKQGYIYKGDVGNGYIDEYLAKDYAAKYVNEIEIGSDESAIATERTGYEFMEWSGIDQSDRLYTEKPEPASLNKSKIIKAEGYYSRQSVQNDPTTLYIFTDNTDRTSGGQSYGEGWYKDKYGEGGFGSMNNPTTAQIRGLENAAPISTMRYFYRNHEGMSLDGARWHDSDIEEFKSVIDSEIEDIKKLWDSGRFTKIIVPNGDGFFNSRIAQISRDSEIGIYLSYKLNELYDYVKGKGSTSQEPINILTISNKTEDFGVEISTSSEEFWNKIKDGWLNKNPLGLVAYRKRGSSAETFTPATVEEGWIGNPFSVNNRGSETVQQFYDWIVTGDSQGNENATDEFRQAIIEKILDTPDDAPVLYYKELGFPSHATVIGYLVRNKGILLNSINSEKSSQTPLSRIAEVLGGKDDPVAKQEVEDVIDLLNSGISFEDALSTVNPIFTLEEIDQIKSTGKKLFVKSVSRLTDPAFFSKEIIKFLEENSKKAFNDPSRVNAIELWTKHDGEPILNILKACRKYKVAPMVQFSITTLGDSELEKGVLKYTDLIPLIKKLILSGDLDPRTTSIRIDPILIGRTNMEDIKNVVNLCKGFGIKKFITSIVQSYGYLDGTDRDRKVTSGITDATTREGNPYDWEKYYGIITQEDFNKWSQFLKHYLLTHPGASWNEAVMVGALNGIRFVSKSQIGKIHHIPKREYIDQVGKILLELNEDPNIKIETCSFYINGLNYSACLDPLIIERLTGIDVTNPDGTYDRDTSRPECMCYAVHGDMYRMNEKSCFSSCAYCYAAHSGDKSFKYYDESGNIIDRPLTRVADDDIDILKESKKPSEKSSSDSSLPGPETKMNIWWGYGENDPNRENADLSNFAERPFVLEDGDISFGMADHFKKQFFSVEQAFQYLKSIIAGDVFEGSDKITEKIANETDGAKLKKLGGYTSLKTYEEGLKNWNEMSSTFMYELLLLSFKLNPQALQRLLSTGNATLTHTQATGKWRTEFPKILMEVREKLRLKQQENKPYHERC